jgi:ribonuclease HI
MKQGIYIYTDGGSRGNPGPAGSGAVVYKNGEEVALVSKFLGTQTNNWAEYEALILALEAAQTFFGSPVREPVVVRMDSELIVKQMKGEYRVKDAELKKKHQRVQAIIAETFPTIVFEHVRREENARADELANEAMDRMV